MRYLFTTLAVGNDYLDRAIDSYEDLSKKLNCDFNITTNFKSEKIGKINFDFFTLDRYNDTEDGFSFYLNLKCLSLKYAIDKNYDYVIYSDADWKSTDLLNEQKMLDVFQFMENEDYDVLFERPAEIGYNKENYDQCFFKEKLRDFHLYDHNLWDTAHVPNEQFMVFKVNWKFRFFVMKWEMFLWYSIANNIRSFPDGFDIGVSIYESTMKYEYLKWKDLLSGCFKFIDKKNHIYTKF